MKRLALGVLLVAAYDTAIAAPDTPAAAVRVVSLDDYAPVLVASSVAVYAIARYVIVNADGADAAKLRTLAPGVQTLVGEFGAKLAALRAVSPDQAPLQAAHRAVLKRFGDLQSWSKDVASVFAAGDRDALIREAARGRSLLRDLQDAYHVLTDEAGKVN